MWYVNNIWNHSHSKNPENPAKKGSSCMLQITACSCKILPKTSIINLGTLDCDSTLGSSLLHQLTDSLCTKQSMNSVNYGFCTQYLMTSWPFVWDNSSSYCNVCVCTNGCCRCVCQWVLIQFSESKTNCQWSVVISHSSTTQWITKVNLSKGWSLKWFFDMGVLVEIKGYSVVHFTRNHSTIYRIAGNIGDL